MVVVHDFDVVRSVVFPVEAYPPPAIDPDAVLARVRSPERASSLLLGRAARSCRAAALSNTVSRRVA